MSDIITAAVAALTEKLSSGFDGVAKFVISGEGAIMMDAGHLSQTFYLLAAEAGLPAFVTAAVNEIDITAALGLDPIRDGVIAVCGCGPASGEQVTVEYR